MPFALVTVGLLLIIVGFQDTYKQFGTQVQQDFTGNGNFIYWVIAIGLLGAIGYVKEFQTFSRALIALVIIAMFLSKKSGAAQGIAFFNSFLSGINSGTTSQVSSPGTPLQGSSNSSSTSGGGSGIIGDIGTAATIANFF